MHDIAVRKHVNIHFKFRLSNLNSVASNFAKLRAIIAFICAIAYRGITNCEPSEAIKKSKNCGIFKVS